MEQDHNRLDMLFNQFRDIKTEELGQAKRLFHEVKAGLQIHIVWEEEVDNTLTVDERQQLFIHGECAA